MGVHDPKSNISRFQISRGRHLCPRVLKEFAIFPFSPVKLNNHIFMIMFSIASVEIKTI